MNCIRVIRSKLLVGFFLGTGALHALPQDAAGPNDIEARRAELDRTVFADERLAQEYEQAFVRLWDDLRAAKDPFLVLAAFPLERLELGMPDEGRELKGLGVGGIRSRTLLEPETFGPADVRDRIAAFDKAGWEIRQTEWHHSRFEPPTETGRARSRVSCVIHAAKVGKKKEQRVIVKAKLDVEWTGERDERGNHVAGTIRVSEAVLLDRQGRTIFKSLEELDPRKLVGSEALRVHPIIACDRGNDGLTDLVLAGCNLVRRNIGNGEFVDEPFLRHFQPVFDAGLLADFTGDGVPDYLAVSADSRYLHLWQAEKNGNFRREPVQAADRLLVLPQVMTAGDVDRDGDLDVFIGQYKRPYEGGNMPDPYYDANDGNPAYYFQNDGSGHFADMTEEVGLGAHRNRRTYSASFVDLDGDVDLDLVVVSDFSGLDLYTNDGSGHFEEITDEAVAERYSFGMSHALADFDMDGALDVYMTGMGSTTARRLVAMGAERDGSLADQMRMPMAFGNRMYLRRGDGYEEPAFRERINRTGWSWGCASADFDNDGDSDFYVANGHVSGKSSQDYCTRFWCHDIYGDGSADKRALTSIFAKELSAVVNYEISWNGYEHNALFLNDSGRDFHEVGFLLGVAKEYDTRAVLAEDFDGDGRVDLFFSRFLFLGQDVAQIGYRMKNVHRGPGHWIGLRLRGAPGVSPIGATVVAQAGDRTWIEPIITGDSYTSQHAPVAHFGLGKRTAVDWIEVRWPNGEVSRIEDPKVDTWHSVQADATR